MTIIILYRDGFTCTLKRRYSLEFFKSIYSRAFLRIYVLYILEQLNREIGHIIIKVGEKYTCMHMFMSTSYNCPLLGLRIHTWNFLSQASSGNLAHPLVFSNGFWIKNKIIQTINQNNSKFKINL